MLYNKRVLIIDGSDSTRTILFKELSSTLPDLDIIACGSAKEAITACRRFQFEIITTGLALPDMDAFAMLDEIRKQIKNRNTPVFVVSGDTHTHIVDPENDDANMVTAYFDKAEGHHALVKFISDYLSKESTLNAKVLYVDHDDSSSAVTTSILNKNHFKYLHVKQGQSAIRELEKDFRAHQRCSYDVLITDMHLTQEMTGFELIQKIRNELDFDFQMLPILLITQGPGDNENTDFTAMFGAGTNDFISRPVTEEDLIERIMNLLNVKRQSEALAPE
ncbi:MAG: response regulator [Gammaproteobacteria bacterium]|nr:response regulator [Gammaproteobacteria bacterium]